MIKQLEIHNDTLYILDSSIAKSLFIFDEYGKFVRKIGHIGKGPGEYMAPEMFFLDLKKREVYILDGNQQKIIVLTLTGKLIREIKLNNQFLCSQFFMDNGFLYFDYMVSKNRNPEYLLTINNNNKLVKSIFPSKIYNKGCEHPFSHSNHFFKVENGFKYSRPFFDTIFSIENNNVFPYIVISTENQITSHDINTMNEYKNMRDFLTYYSRECKKFLGVSGFYESKNIIILTYRNKLNNYTLFYCKDKNLISCTNNFIDDLTFTMFPDKFLFVYNNHFVTCAQSFIPHEMEAFIENVKKNIIKLPEKEQLKLNNITTNSNPLVIFYECGEEMKNLSE